MMMIIYSSDRRTEGNRASACNCVTSLGGLNATRSMFICVFSTCAVKVGLNFSCLQEKTCFGKYKKVVNPSPSWESNPNVHVGSFLTLVYFTSEPHI